MTSVHNTTQNSFDNFPSYLQTTIITQMLSVGGKGGEERKQDEDAWKAHRITRSQPVH